MTKTTLKICDKDAIFTDKQAALALFLDEEVDAIEQSYDESNFEYGNTGYIVLTDDEADKKAKEEIEESLWAFNASFILNYAGIYTPEAEKAMQKMQGAMCESANDLIKAMIGGKGIGFNLKYLSDLNAGALFYGDAMSPVKIVGGSRVGVLMPLRV